MGQATNGVQAILEIQRIQPDIVFADSGCRICRCNRRYLKGKKSAARIRRSWRRSWDTLFGSM